MPNYPSLGDFPKSAVLRRQEPPMDINQWQKGDDQHDILIASKDFWLMAKLATLQWRNPADTPSFKIAGVQPRLIQGIRRGDGVGDYVFIYLFIKDIKNNRMRIAQ